MQKSLSEINDLPSKAEAVVTETKLDSPGVPNLIAEKLKNDIDEYAIRTYGEAHRWHLGASIIGHDCSRYLWYTFRWCNSEIPDGRMLRLFNRGHREEARFIEFINGIGGEIWTHESRVLHYHAESESYHIGLQFDPGDGLVSDVTGISKHEEAALKQDSKLAPKQFKMSALQGHFGGSMDGVLKLPPRYGIEEPLLAEFKTNGTGKAFNDVRDNGVAVAKAQHWAQMSTYGNAYKLRYAAYFIVNKNDDDLEIQIVKLDWRLGEQMTDKAERIIRSQEPPPKLSDQPTYFKCQYCSMKAICHGNQKPEFNCRSCINALPAENAEWFCKHHNAIIPREYVIQGCNSYKAIVND